MTREERGLHWRGLLDEQAESGLSAAAFCRNRDINLHRFYRWRRRLQNEIARKPAGSFLELIPSCPQQESGVRIRLSSGACIEVERGFDPETLRNVVKALGQG